MRESLPAVFFDLRDVSEAVRQGWEFNVFPQFLGALVLLDEGIIVGLLNLEDLHVWKEGAGSLIVDLVEGGDLGECSFLVADAVHFLALLLSTAKQEHSNQIICISAFLC